LDNKENGNIVQANETERLNTGKWESQISEEERLKREDEREIPVGDKRLKSERLRENNKVKQ
jgi:hypothetical protein